MLNIQNLIDDAKCDETVRELRWPEGGRCAHGGSAHLTKRGRDTAQPHRQKYRGEACGRYFDDLSGTVFAGPHQPLKTWVLCLYFMGLNLSNQRIARELGLNKDDGQRLTKPLRHGVAVQPPRPVLSGEFECDEVYGVAGHKGPPAAVKKKAARAAGDDSKEPVAAAAWRRSNRRFRG